MSLNPRFGAFWLREMHEIGGCAQFLAPGFRRTCSSGPVSWRFARSLQGGGRGRAPKCRPCPDSVHPARGKCTRSGVARHFCPFLFQRRGKSWASEWKTRKRVTVSCSGGTALMGDRGRLRAFGLLSRADARLVYHVRKRKRSKEEKMPYARR